MSLIMLEDFIKKKVKLTDNEATKISKVIGEFKLREAYSLMWFNNSTSFVVKWNKKNKKFSMRMFSCAC